MPIASTDWRLAWPSSRKQVWQRGCSRMFYKGSNCGSLTSEEVKYAKVYDQFFLPCLFSLGSNKYTQFITFFVISIIFLAPDQSYFLFQAQDPCLAPRRHATNRGAALPACAAPVRQRNRNISAFLVGVATSISGPDLQLSQQLMQYLLYQMFKVNRHGMIVTCTLCNISGATTWFCGLSLQRKVISKYIVLMDFKQTVVSL